MRKIHTLFVRNPENKRLVTEEVTPGLEWVLAGEGIPYEKIDGTACAVSGGVFYVRMDHSTAMRNNIPAHLLLPCQGPDDPEVEKYFWYLCPEFDPCYKWHRRAWENMGKALPDGTYELIGPKIQKYAYGLERQALINHQHPRLILPWDTLPTFNRIRDFLEKYPMEGIVWHHLDGRMAKIKRRDFGLPWPGNEIKRDLSWLLEEKGL